METQFTAAVICLQIISTASGQNKMWKKTSVSVVSLRDAI